MPLGFQAAQIVHAVGDSVQEPHQPGTNAVVLSVSSELEIRVVAKKLQLAGIPHTIIQEIDMPWNGQITAIGLVPTADRAAIKKILSSLPLLGKVDKKICSVQEEAILPVVQSQN